MQFDVFVQGNFYKSLAAKNSGEVLAIVARDIKKSLVPGFDSSKNHDIKVVPKVVEDAFDNMDSNRDGRISRDEFKTK
jgi:Ca2+-binding EF-hand superfamily protein